MFYNVFETKDMSTVIQIQSMKKKCYAPLGDSTTFYDTTTSYQGLF